MLIKAARRGTDKFGSGHYLAPRGNHKHHGIDIACIQGSTVLAVSAGTVTKIGYPYDPSNPKKGHLRYVEITDESGYKVRYFYIKPTVSIHQKIKRHDEIGITQGLTKVYPGITDHFHFEVMLGGDVREFIDPDLYLLECDQHAL